jgi:adenine-specific DNA methylase
MKKKTQSPSLLDFETGETVTDKLAEWRNLQASLFNIQNPYVGNKRKLVVDIALALEKHEIKFESMIDLFSGSSVVGLFFKMIGKQVFSNDLLTSSFFNAKVFVENEDTLLTPADIRFLCDNPHAGRGTFVQTHYAERFMPEEARFLDNYRGNIDLLAERVLKRKLDTPSDAEMLQRTAEAKRAAAFVLIEHYVLSQCFLGGRLNKGQVLAELGHRIDHKRNSGNEMRFQLPELPRFVKGGSVGDSAAFNMDAEEFLQKAPIPHVDLLYLDPPYGSSQSDYASMFAWCEEYIYGKKLEELPHIQNAKKFVQKKDYENHFRSLLSECERFPTWAVSFNDDSFTDCDGIVAILKDYKKNVTVEKIEYQYKYRKDENTSGVEYLLIAR